MSTQKTKSKSATHRAKAFVREVKTDLLPGLKDVVIVTTGSKTDAQMAKLAAKVAAQGGQVNVHVQQNGESVWELTPAPAAK